MELSNKNLISRIPKEVSHVTQILEKAGFEVYLVGGCVRDLIINREPKDWDVTTNSTPEEIIPLFEKTVYENTFGTVGVCIPVTHETTHESVSHVTKEEKYNIVEVTPYRTEAKYSDFRHPDSVKFSKNIEDDLKRRDFTINAIAMDTKGNIKDMFGGIKDIEDGVLRTVGNPDDRFEEDALRILRAIRFSCQLNFSIAHEVIESILKNSNLITKISSERIRDEFEKIIMSKNPASGVMMLHKFGLLKYIIPELEEGIGCEQGGAHIFDVWDHLLHALQHAADKDWSFEIRIAALFHDIGKPRTKREGTKSLENSSAFLQSETGGRSKNSSSLSPLQKGKTNSRVFLHPTDGTFRHDNLSSLSSSSNKKPTFYGHEVVGARMAKKIMERLKFPHKQIELVEKLVRNHMFFSDTEQITLSAVRRIITKMGAENIWLLMNIRECDRVGMKKKEAPYRLRKYFAMIEEALRDPISPKTLKINGEFMMKELGIAPGPRMGWILSALLEEVLDAPEKNTVEHLSELVKSLNMLGDKELKALGDRGKEKKEELEEKEVAKLHQKHGVQK